MKIAIVTENFLPKLDGVTRTIAMLLEHLQKKSHQAIVLGPEGSVDEYAGAKVVHINGIAIPFYPELKFLLPTRGFKSYIQDFQPDIVHLADPMLLGMAGIYWAQKQSIPIVAGYHTNIANYMSHYGLGPLAPTAWKYRKFLHNQCDVTLCPSQSTAKVLEKQGFERIKIWPRGVDSVLFHPAKRSAEIRKSLGAEDDTTPLLLYAGRLSHEKNISTLAEAFRIISAGHPVCRLVVVGDGPARQDLEQSLAGLPVTFTGYQRGEDLAVYYASCDIFIFPSTSETFGQVVQEAMASGLPVIGANAEGVCDIVRDGETGLLTAPQNAEETAAAAHMLLYNPDELRRMRQNARAFAETRSWSEIMDNLLHVYEDILKNPAPNKDVEFSPLHIEDIVTSLQAEAETQK